MKPETDRARTKFRRLVSCTTGCRHTVKHGSKYACGKPVVAVWETWWKGHDRYITLPVCEEHDTLLRNTNDPLPEDW